MASVIYCLTSIVVFVIIDVTGLSCPDEWTYYEQDQTCMRYNEGETSWYNARDTCRRFNADLVIIRDQHKNDFVSNLAGPRRKYMWIGMYKVHMSSPFQYTDDTILGHFQPWDRYQPNRDGRCMAMWVGRRRPGNWSDIHCEESGPFMCSKPDECPDGWRMYRRDRTCLKLFANSSVSHERGNWISAAETCMMYGGDLVIIRDDHKNTFVHYVMDGAAEWAWIGIKDYGENGIRFVDGKLLGDYRPWHQEYQRGNVHEEACVVFIMDGLRQWSTRQCHTIGAFVCSL